MGVNHGNPSPDRFSGHARALRRRSAIANHITQLEDRFGRVTAGRVVLKAPGGHHRTGGLYEINIRLALPDGKEVNVGRTAQNDERHSDLTFAINDAFKRARRQLQDQVRTLQGQVKQHDGSPIGTVVRLDPPVNSVSLNQATAMKSIFTAIVCLTMGFPG
jgi:hypothetical protein